MADVFYNITGSTGPNFTGNFVVSNLTNVVQSTVPTSIVVATPFAYSFVPTNVQLYPNGSGTGDYVTWRTYAGPSQYPDSGESLDVWSTALAGRINAGDTWQQLVAFNGGVYALQTNKYCTLYNYDGPFARWYGYGGTLTLST